MNWLGRLIGKRQLEIELSRELGDHLERQIADYRKAGFSEEESRRKAHLSFGGLEQTREECREARGTLWLEFATQDLKHAFRNLKRAPAFTIAALLTLALGVGATTAIFQLINSVRLKSLPVVKPSELALIRLDPKANTFGVADNFHTLTYPLFKEVRDHQTGFSDVFGWELDGEQVGQGAGAKHVDRLAVSGNFFTALGIPPAAGRLFRDDDDVYGCSDPGVVLSYEYWRRIFSAQPSAIGASLVVQDHRLRVIGVTPAGFRGPEIGRKFDIALPLCASAALRHNDVSEFRRRDYFWIYAMGRLKGDSTIAAASAQLNAVSSGVMLATEPTGYSQAESNRYLRFHLEAVPGAMGVSQLRDKYDTSLWFLWGVTAFVLLIACLNLANLMFARLSANERESAVRVALGATRARLMGQILAETFLLTIGGVVGGLVLAKALSSGIVRLITTENNPINLELTLDWHMIAFAAATTVSICALLAIISASKSAGIEPDSALKGESRSVTGDRRQFRSQRLLVVAQIAVSSVLVTAALLFVYSFHNLVTAETGFRPDGLLTASFNLSTLTQKSEAIRVLRRQLLEEVRSTPLVQATASASNFLFSDGMWTMIAEANGSRSAARFLWVSPGHFFALQTLLLAGRDFNNSDTETSPQVAIINQTFVRKFFRGLDPLGKTFHIIAEPGYPGGNYQVVGIAKDTKYFNLRDLPPPVVYAPASQDPGASLNANLYIRSSALPSRVEATVRHRISSSHPEVAMEFHVFKNQIADNVVRERLLALLSGSFGLLAVLLAIIGLYGVLAYTLQKRRTEMGVRVALGATSEQMIWLVFQETAMLVGAGLAIGLTCSLAINRTAQALLFNISATDPLVTIAAAILLGGAACLGSLLPAVRVSRIDPIAALRAE